MSSRAADSRAMNRMRRHQERRHLLQALARGDRLDAHAAGGIGKRGDRLDDVLARKPVVLGRGGGVQRDVGERRESRLEPARDAGRVENSQ